MYTSFKEPDRVKVCLSLDCVQLEGNCSFVMYFFFHFKIVLLEMHYSKAGTRVH